MDRRDQPPIILMADDDDDDIFLTQDALARNKTRHLFTCVPNGVELLEYLRHEGKYKDPEISPRPNLILLDLNMPRVSGLEALGEIKQDTSLCSIPVVVLSTSNSEDDINKSYNRGANSFITKPHDFQGFIRIMRSLDEYWLQTAKLPD